MLSPAGICDAFKRTVPVTRRSLSDQSYNEHIGELRTDMEEATRATELLRHEIDDFRQGFVTVLVRNLRILS